MVHAATAAPRILIGVLAVEQPVYQRLVEEGLRKTWPRDVGGDVEILYYYGGRATTTVDGDRVFFPTAEGVFNVAGKTALFFRHVLEHRTFDYLFRTNCSSYVDIPNLRRFLADA